LNEISFITRLIEQIPSAYNDLLDEYGKKVYNTCLSFVPNTEDAEDIAQEVFIEIYNSIKKFRGDSSLSTWIYRISVNKSLEFIRKKNTKKRFGFIQSITGNTLPVVKSSYFTEFNHPGVILEQKEQKEMLFIAINQLPESQKIIFTLHMIDDLSYKEISAITEKSISSIESLLFRARKNLKNILTKHYKKER